jgi:hypothetical protein
MRRILIFGGVRGGGAVLAFAHAAWAPVLIPPIRNVLPSLSVMFGRTDIPVVAPAPEETP